MDDASWQNKCGGSTWQPPLLQRSKSYFESSLTMQHQRFALNGGIPEPLFLNNLNGGFYKTDDSELLSSFLDVPSVPSSLVKYDNNQPISLAGELPNSSCVVIHSPAKGAVPQMNLPLSANLGNGNDKSGCFPSSFVSSKSLGFDNRRVGAGTSPVFSTRELFSNDYKRATVTCNDLRTSNINLTSLELGRAIDHQFVPGFEIEMQISSPLNELSAFNQANIGVLQSTNSQQLDKSSLSADTSTCNQTNTFVSACPRVYCLSKSGNLFLSHTGLFGVVCLCHSMQMSVSKFCEHSGLLAINPGEAVHMDNGMTIAVWRKLYFQKFAIKAPEDRSGWDWPQWYSINAESELVKSRSALSNMSNSYDLSSSPKVFVLSGGPRENASFPTNVHSSEILPKWVQHRDNEDKCNFDSKSLTLTSPHSSCSVLIGCPVGKKVCNLTSTEHPANQASFTLVNEMKFMDQNEVLSGLYFHEKINHPQIVERSLKFRKRKRVKWKILDATVPGSGLVSVFPSV